MISQHQIKYNTVFIALMQWTRSIAPPKRSSHTYDVPLLYPVDERWVARDCYGIRVHFIRCNAHTTLAYLDTVKSVYRHHKVASCWFSEQFYQLEGVQYIRLSSIQRNWAIRRSPEQHSWHKRYAVYARSSGCKGREGIRPWKRIIMVGCSSPFSLFLRSSFLLTVFIVSIFSMLRSTH